ncbi:putative Baculoviral IAP repeat-containing protein 6 [Monocercomonoides exilis]|uniref:putative Baculoviral IAP repeat-containing protein 6 n=1 Tax=Monocercomonoides exilis TaxID=2049356 RepID=UPI00355AC312|nr:putative Baculoviral IAP repeat-containing protein 6 [Monocercomonoides exilis]|eukprot:MONOS_2580.1-p1 / transcript=MONOS_2580.1 / gene=MONOS_2580 / organism=Monocercomonoides_exilis_PA203 / gene_product=Baculoviral IAP repeat-containing protein 6 / transcript_product=Baculoviral IAP repeat-containing protein 6 / location=Mono_scaffold00054:58426-60210(-) / protein_length=512 / sequence_SO=supercontig / SO=protein_coding / is_pseudo=false
MAQQKVQTDLDKLLKSKIYSSFLEEKSSSSSRSSSHSSRSSRSAGWASGTGYGSGSGTGSFAEIDKRQAELQKESDRQFEGLNALVEFIQTIPPSKRKALAEGLAKSQLPKILCTLLSDDSFMSMSQMAQVYFSAFQIIAMLSINDDLAKIIYQPTASSTHTIFEKFKQMKAAADVFLDLHSTTSGGREGDDEEKLASKENSLLLAEKIKTLYGHLEEVYEERYSEAARGRSQSSAGSVEDQYLERMRQLQFVTTSNTTLFRGRHVYANKLVGQTMMPDMRRIMNELSSLHSTLPLQWESSVFVVVDTASSQLVKAMIVGPRDTPYEAGLFEFDIFYPSNYPRSPPLVQIVTTGGGTVRFNPNLYSNGKVCLSLLGTWSGDSGESWNPTHSTLIQVLISIQALILVDHPYFNEPGYESSMGTPEGDRQSKMYNTDVRKNCVKLAMIDQIEKAKAGKSEFSDVIITHFALQKERVMRVVESWKRDTGIDASDIEKLRNLLNSLSLPSSSSSSS